MQTCNPGPTGPRVSTTPVVLAVLTLLAGCATELRSVHVGNSADVPLAGAPYNLTFTQYELRMVRRLVTCPGSGSTEAEDRQMKVVTQVVVKPLEVRDPAREYVIDFLALRSFLKTTDMKVEYHENGALKSVNASADDKTAETLGAVVGAVGKVALATVSPAAAAASKGTFGVMVKPSEEVADACKFEVQRALRDLPKLQADLKRKTRELERATVTLSQLVAWAAGLGDAVTNDLRKRFDQQFPRVIGLQDEVQVLKDKLEAVLETLTTEAQAQTWPPDGETRKSAGALFKDLSAKELGNWAHQPAPGTLADLQARTRVHAGLQGATPMSMPHADPNRQRPADATVAGLKYRMAVPGALRLCNQACDTRDAEEIGRHPGLISQLGPVMTLPLKNHPFMTQTLSASFDPGGRPTALGYRSEASAEKAAGALNNVVDEVLKVREARQPKTELQQLKDETELLEAQAKNAAAKKALDPARFTEQADAVAAFDADRSVLEARLALLKAQQAMDAAEAQAGTP